MSGFQRALASATKALQSSGLPFAIVGGVAVSARTEPRFTQDVDFTVAVQSDEAAQHLAHMLFGRGFRQHALPARSARLTIHMKGQHSQFTHRPCPRRRRRSAGGFASPGLRWRLRGGHA